MTSRPASVSVNRVMNIWGIAIPGLAMNCNELPIVPGMLRLQNPEVGNGETFSSAYTLEEVALLHARKIAELKIDAAQKFHVIGMSMGGMSMGGMIVSILATKYRQFFPLNSRFQIFVSSPNFADSEALPNALIQDWLNVRRGNVVDFRRTLKPSFSKSFLNSHSNEFEAYVQYRIRGENGQTPRGFMRQVAAIQAFGGEKYYPELNPKECRFVNGLDDDIFGAAHRAAQKRLAPEVRFLEIKNMGHMVHLERPDLFGATQVFD